MQGVRAELPKFTLMPSLLQHMWRGEGGGGDFRDFPPGRRPLPSCLRPSRGGGGRGPLRGLSGLAADLHGAAGLAVQDDAVLHIGPVVHVRGLDAVVLVVIALLAMLVRQSVLSSCTQC
eukprot:4028904-Pyramimonas_sp.AAC.1